ncbi:hypothetical protein BST61_g9297 [Cercospora zeina]
MNGGTMTNNQIDLISLPKPRPRSPLLCRRQPLFRSRAKHLPTHKAHFGIDAITSTSSPHPAPANSSTQPTAHTA